MLLQGELTSLYQIISEESKSFEEVASTFQKTYNKQDQFKVGVTLWFLIKDNILNLSQKLASFYILYDMNRLEKASNPFIPIILESLQSSSNKVEQKLLVDFLENKIDYQSKSIASFKEENSKLEKVEIPDINEYWNNYNKSNEKFSSSITDWVRPVIYDRKEKDIKNGDSLPPFNIKQLTPEEVSFNYFEPNYMTYFPNTNYPYLDDEPMWIMPTLNFDFVWDFTMTPEPDTLVAILNKPMNDRMASEEEIKVALNLIEKDPELLKQINFSPENLMKLVDKNDSFAGEILLKISKSIIFEE